MSHFWILSTIFCVSILRFGYGNDDSEARNESMWNKWKQTYNVTYSRFEENFRKQIFLDNLKLVVDHNNKALPFKLQVYEFADRSLEEFVRIRTGLRVPLFFGFPRTNLTETDVNRDGMETSESTMSSTVESTTSYTDPSNTESTPSSTEASTIDYSISSTQTSNVDLATSSTETSTIDSSTSSTETSTVDLSTSSTETSTIDSSTSSTETSTIDSSTSSTETSTVDLSTSSTETSTIDLSTSSTETSTIDSSTSIAETSTIDYSISSTETSTIDLTTSSAETSTIDLSTSIAETSTTDLSTSSTETFTIDLSTSSAETSTIDLSTSSAATSTIDLSTSSAETSTIDLSTSSAATSTIDLSTSSTETSTIDLTTSSTETSTIDLSTSSTETSTIDSSTSIAETSTADLSSSSAETSTVDLSTSSTETSTIDSTSTSSLPLSTSTVSSVSTTSTTLASSSSSHSSTTQMVTKPPTEYVNWVEKGHVTNVKNQGKCGSCWAFAAIASLESQFSIHNKEKNLNLSEQQLVDCDYRQWGCWGGWPYSTMERYTKNNGVTLESNYAYIGFRGFCRWNFRWKVYKNVKQTPYELKGDEQKLKDLVKNVGPAVVGVHATRLFQFYKSGIFSDTTCKTNQLNHAIVIVGYGTTEDGHDYWLIKNSWGTSWGENGYMRMLRNKNMCGVANYGGVPIIAD